MNGLRYRDRAERCLMDARVDGCTEGRVIRWRAVWEDRPAACFQQSRQFLPLRRLPGTHQHVQAADAGGKRKADDDVLRSVVPGPACLVPWVGEPADELDRRADVVRRGGYPDTIRVIQIWSRARLPRRRHVMHLSDDG